VTRGSAIFPRPSATRPGCATISKLPIYRPGLAPLQRGLEIGVAHGFFLIGPFVKLGPLRNSDYANLAALASALGLILIAKAGMRLYGIAVFPKGKSASEPLATYSGWADLSKGFLKGGAVGALGAFVILEILHLVGV
jgi:photosystem I subunit XI